MLTLYAISALVGGVLVGVSLFLGGDTDTDVDTDFDAEVDVDVEADIDGDADLDADGQTGADAHPEGGAGVWLPFLSLRFWTFCSAFFGLTGLALSFFTVTPWVFTMAAASMVGLFSGTLVSWLVRRLKASQSDSSVTELELGGTTAKVLLPLTNGLPGKVRVNAKGHSVDLPAVAENTEAIGRGSEVLIISIHDGEARVTLLDTEALEPKGPSDSQAHRPSTPQSSGEFY